MGQGFFRDPPKQDSRGILKVLAIYLPGALIPEVEEEGTHYLCQEGEPYAYFIIVFYPSVAPQA